MTDVRFRLYLGCDQQGKPIDKAEMLRFFTQHVDTVLEGYTVIDGVDWWHGKEEQCLILEHMADDTAAYVIKLIGQHWKEQFKQEAVLMTTEPVEVEIL